MKNVILGLILSLCTTVGFAQELNLSGDVDVGSRYIYRGVELNNDPTVGVEGKLDNVLVPGLYVTGSANSLSTTPLNSTTTRSDVGVGYHNDLGTENFDVDVSLHRVWNPSIYASAQFANVYPNVFQNNYDEARARVSYKWFGFATSYLEVGQIVSTGFSRDTYGAVGLEANVFSPDLTVGAKVSGEHYRDASVTRYNNSEAYASYKLWKGLSAEASYSFGGKYVDNSNIDDHAYVGVRYSF